jgi:hypothetical protein
MATGDRMPKSLAAASIRRSARLPSSTAEPFCGVDRLDQVDR